MAQCFGVGKCIIKVLKSGVELNKQDLLSEDICDIIEEATVFMTAIYVVKSEVHGRKGLVEKLGLQNLGHSHLREKHLKRTYSWHAFRLPFGNRQLLNLNLKL